MCINDKICIPPPPKKEKPVVIVKPKPVKKPKVFKGTKLTAWIEGINELGNVTVFLNQPLNMDAFKKGSLDNNSFELVLEKGPTSKVPKNIPRQSPSRRPRVLMGIYINCC